MPWEAQGLAPTSPGLAGPGPVWGIPFYLLPYVLHVTASGKRDSPHQGGESWARAGATWTGAAGMVSRGIVGGKAEPPRSFQRLPSGPPMCTMGRCWAGICDPRWLSLHLAPRSNFLLLKLPTSVKGLCKQGVPSPSHAATLANHSWVI